MDTILFIASIIVILIAVKTRSAQSDTVRSFITYSFIGAGALVILIAAQNQAQAAEINVIKRDAQEIIVLYSGSVEQGDGERLYGVLKALGDMNPKATITVELVSGGGVAMEGWNLAAAIRAAGANTLVPQNSMCASACTYAFMGGVKRHLRGTLGYHLVWYSVRDMMVPSKQVAEEFGRGQAWGVMTVSNFLRFAGKDADYRLASFILDAYKYSLQSDNDILRLRDHTKCVSLGICN